MKLRAAHRSDQDLLTAIRNGDRDAYTQLWERHAAAIRKAATFFTTYDADDITAETFTRILRSIDRGHGPTTAFRSYALVTAKNIAAEWGRSHREVALEHVGDKEDPSLSAFTDDSTEDRSLAVRAFQALPDRWQEILWYSEVERMQPAQIAPLLGMKPNAVAALAVRAREGLRQEWIQAHLQSDHVPDEHKWVIEKAGKYARNKLTPAMRRSIDAHLDACPNCRLAYDEVDHAGSRVAAIILPLTLGPAAAGYVAWAADQNVSASAAPLPRRHTRHAAVVTGAALVAALAISMPALSDTFSHPTTPRRTEAAAPTSQTTPPKSSTAEQPAATPPAARSVPTAMEAPQPLTPVHRTPAEGDAPASPASETESPRAAPVAARQQQTPPQSATPAPSPSPSAPDPAPVALPKPPTLTLYQDDPSQPPSASGTGVPGAEVTLTWTDAIGTELVVTSAVDADGTWEQEPPPLPRPGTYTVRAVQTIASQGVQRTSAPVLTGATVTKPAG
ncbi:sigma-70 family RNA polymerase sigma factor [Curtobacterium sp. Csp1]|uniref:sigma-70 family RNA polymerase sigma factor n=1 Tax=Curtobacterium sp. Csp1 TaxID=2495429 RepID=UPI00159A4727|nr:sigma-70 family RNA polymerase sigma factor [Curtobacterium sp. Csp1]QKS18856.1 sigma-70 family RNA polymerase sigma factor [Curtobacterium sp. Csp1]